MKHLKEFNKWTGQEVADHIESITPEENDIPDYFINKYILPNDGWENKDVKLKDLLKDKDFKEYYKSGEERYDEYEVSDDDLYQELVVYKGQLLDGYSRAARMLRNGEKTAGAFVLENTTIAGLNVEPNQELNKAAAGEGEDARLLKIREYKGSVMDYKSYWEDRIKNQ